MPLLSPGEKLTSIYSKETCTVGDLLGEGTQGEVYRVRFSGGVYVLKCYKKSYLKHDAGLRERLDQAIQLGSPSPSFIWPFDLVQRSPASGLGYLMPLIEPRFVRFTELLNGSVAPSFSSVCTTGIQLSHNFLRLHSKGLCYKDINFGNIFFDPANGDVRIADNDNVDIDGRPGAISGSRNFMAPEVVCKEAPPSRLTDLYSLAVLLFYTLMINHPLVGKRELDMGALTEENMNRLFGTDPLFVFDPDDRSNAPVPGYHDNALAFWPVYPQFVRDLFIRSFTEGLRDPVNGRVQEGEWRTAFCQLKDSIFACALCGNANFYDAEQAASGALGACWSCNSVPPFPPRMRVGTHVVMLRPGIQLLTHHLEGWAKYDLDRAQAEVIGEPLRLCNLSTRSWIARLPDNSVRSIGPGEVLPLSSGVKIDFGRVEGRVRL